MIEVFRTNVIRRSDATLLVDRISTELPDHVANFDLDDCDRILRVKTNGKILLVNSILRLMEAEGFNAEVLPDDPAAQTPDSSLPPVNVQQRVSQVSNVNTLFELT